MSADSSLTYSLMSSLSLYSHNVPKNNNNNNELLNRQYNTSKKRSIWSEGLERNIDTIVLGKYDNSKPHQKLVAEMKRLGKTLGFNVAESDVKESGWIEDIGIRRADGKVYVLPKMGNCSDIKTGQDVEFNWLFPRNAVCLFKYFNTIIPRSCFGIVKPTPIRCIRQ